MTFLQILGLIADICGVLSLLLGIITLTMAVGIKKSLLKYVEKSDYLKDIDEKISALKSYYDTMLKDDSLYNDILLQQIDAELDDIYISYETILPKKTLSEITALRKHIKNKALPTIKDKNAKQECIKKLHSIFTRLRKEKKLL